MPSRHQHKTTPSELPSEFLFEITEVLNAQYKEQRDSVENEVFQANALIYQTEIVLVVTLSKPKSPRTQNIYASMDYTKEQTSINEAIYHLVDSVGYYLEEYFESNREVSLPDAWTKYEINEKTVYLKGDTVNISLEKIGSNIIENS
jgi:hypothetical protein